MYFLQRVKSDLVVDLQNSFVLKGGSNNKQNLIHVSGDVNIYFMMCCLNINILNSLHLVWLTTNYIAYKQASTSP